MARPETNWGCNWLQYRCSENLHALPGAYPAKLAERIRAHNSPETTHSVRADIWADCDVGEWMARQLHRLGAVKVAMENKSGLYADGGGLYLRISDGRNAGRRWVFIYRRDRTAPGSCSEPSGEGMVSIGSLRQTAIPIEAAEPSRHNFPARLRGTGRSTNPRVPSPQASRRRPSRLG